MRVLITGGAGYIGSHTLRAFLRRGHEAWAFDNLCYGHAASVPKGRLIVGDIADTQAVGSTLGKLAIDAVVHFAAFTSVPESVRLPGNYYRNNLAGTIGLLEACTSRGVGRFVLSSTAAVYGTPERVPISEDAEARPINPYGRGKLAAEWAAIDQSRAHGMAFAALRYFNASGASPDGDIGEDHTPETHLIPLVLAAALGRRDGIDVFGTDYPTPDGTCVRDYIHVDDLASAHVLAVEAARPGQPEEILNLGTGRGHSVLEVVRACEEVTGRKVPLRYGPRRPGDPAVLVASAEKATARLGWRPKYTELRGIVETAYRWHVSHPQGYRSHQAAAPSPVFPTPMTVPT